MDAPARLHSLDSLRAAMMWLGIVFHSAITYTTFPIAVWRFRDRFTSPVCDVVYFFTHVFRMPLFFVLAGFFASLLHERLGTREFLRQRMSRIAVPFAVGWALLYLPTRAGMLYGMNALSPSPWQPVRAFFESGAYLRHPATIHLWFLYYLLYFYAAALVIAWACTTMLNPLRRARLKSAFRALVHFRGRALVLALPTCAALFFIPSGGFDPATGFLLRPAPWTAFALFFAFGWLLWGEKDLLPRMQRDAVWQVVVALALLPLNAKYAAETLRAGSAHNAEAHAIASVTAGLLSWLLIFGFLGLAQQYLDQGAAWVRYLSDASYWMYLVHLPLVIWMQIALVHWNVPALVKWLVVVITVTVSTLVTYELFVRRTFISSVLLRATPNRSPRQYGLWQR